VRLRVFVVAAVVWVASLPAKALAQGAANPGELLPRLEIGPYIGGARHSPAGHLFGVIPDRNHLFLGVELTMNVVRTPRWAFGLSSEVVPVLIVSNNPTYRSVSTARGGRFIIEAGRRSVTGFAVSPLGLQAQVKISSRLRAYASGAGGVVWFSREVPVADSRAFNYTFELGGGVRWQVRRRESLRIGYKFHHLSNGYTAPQNPGLDAKVFLVGYERALGSDQRRTRSKKKI
jgi:Lipid A 3-O-deacylase (PagL)